MNSKVFFECHNTGEDCRKYADAQEYAIADKRVAVRKWS